MYLCFGTGCANEQNFNSDLKDYTRFGQPCQLKISKLIFNFYSKTNYIYNQTTSKVKTPNPYFFYLIFEKKNANALSMKTAPPYNLTNLVLVHFITVDVQSKGRLHGALVQCPVRRGTHRGHQNVPRYHLLVHEGTFRQHEFPRCICHPETRVSA